MKHLQERSLNTDHVNSSPGPKVYLNDSRMLLVCHHLSSVYHIFSPTTWPNVTIIGRSAAKVVQWSSTLYIIFVPFGNSTCLLWLIMLFDWLKIQISSTQKPHMWWKCHIVEMFLPLPCIKFVLDLLIGKPRWPPP